MDHRVPRIGTAVSLVLALAALITFLFLNNRFEGPDPTAFLRSPYQLTAKFQNTKTLPTKQPVLYKGISVGRVNRVEWDPDERVGVVTFTLEDEFDLYADAVLRIGERSLLGDPYLNVVSRGTERAPRLDAGDEVTQTEPSVDFDEALDFLDQRGRRRVKSMLHTLAEGTAPAGNAERLNGTIGAAARTVREMNALTRSLRGQEEHIADLVTSAGTVLTEIAARERAVRRIVGSGRVTFDALAANKASLDRAMQELPRLLRSGRRALAEAEPLFAEARPLVADLRQLAPDLTRAFEESGRSSLGAVTRETVRVVDGLTPLRRVAEPVLGKTVRLMRNLDELVAVTGQVARSLVPALAYLTPRVDTISGLYALVAAAAKTSDERSHYVRVGVTIDPAEQEDSPQPANCDPATQDQEPNRGYCNNAYPGPGDALDPQPFEPPYPQIVPCTVPSRETPEQPCR